MVVYEHALFMLLLLVGIYNARLQGQRRTLFLIVGGILLALLPPAVRLTIPWQVILFLTIPLLFWQNARHWLYARWRITWQEGVLWLITALSLGLVLFLSGYLAWTGSVLFGLVTTSMLWRAIEPDVTATHLSQIGPLALIFLLAEIAPTVETPTYYLGGLFSGAGVGLGVALLAAYLAQRASPSRKGWIAVGEVYLAYWIAAFVDASAVAAALVAIVVYIEMGLRRGLELEKDLLPAPIDRWPVFGLLLALFVFLGWQAHQPLTPVLLWEAGLGFLFGWAVAWVGRRLQAPGFREVEVLWQVGLRVGSFVFAALLLWPRSLLVEPLQLAVALGIALVMTALAVVLVSATVSLQEK